jgi:Hint domain
MGQEIHQGLWVLGVLSACRVPRLASVHQGGQHVLEIVSHLLNASGRPVIINMKGIAADARVMTSRGDRLAARLGPGMMLLAVTPGVAPFQRVLGIRNIPYRGPLIRLLPGVLGNMAPREDLLLLPDQRVVFQGRSYRVGDLADGVAIRQEEAPANFTAIDILLESRAAILVQGASLEMGQAHLLSLGSLERVPIDPAITAHIALMAAEIALDAKLPLEAQAFQTVPGILFPSRETVFGSAALTPTVMPVPDSGPRYPIASTVLSNVVTEPEPEPHRPEKPPARPNKAPGSAKGFSPSLKLPL